MDAYRLVYVFGLDQPLTAELMRESLETFGFSVRVDDTEHGFDISIPVYQCDNLRVLKRAYPARFKLKAT